MSLARVRLERHEYRSAETILRATLASYEPSCNLVTVHLREPVGRSLAAQMKYDEAEPLLLSGYEGMNERKESIAVFSRHFIEEARKSLVNLYKAGGKSDKAADWAAKRAAQEQ